MNFHLKPKYNDLLINLVDSEPKIFYKYRLAKCLYIQERYKEAKYELYKLKATDEPNFFKLDCEFAFAYPRTLYLLGKIHEELDEKQEAIETYQKFLHIWKNADEDLPEKIDAQKRLANLLNQG